jgi:phospholipid transport system substrate-binding protein
MRVRSSILSLVVAALVMSAVQSEARADAADPSALVTDLGLQLGRILRDRALSPVEQQQRFRAVLDTDFDFPVISRFVLGRYWQSSSDAFHLEFANVFEDYVIESLSHQFADYSGESINVTATHVESERSTIVSTTIVHPNGGSRANVDWRVQNTPSGFKIADVSVAGVSMAMTYREQIAAVIDHDGGQVTSVISTLREKIASNTRDAMPGNEPAKVGAR